MILETRTLSTLKLIELAGRDDTEERVKHTLSALFSLGQSPHTYIMKHK